ncbi:MAG: LytTR family DNA-binding domain-containing protein [Clostridiales bacterium]|nr:LytTR family DNA-binding domain-containing protein [Clostridiales bacterium]
MRIAIAEDEPIFAQQVQTYLQRFAEENQLSLTVQTYSDGAELVEDYRPVWDILLLDVDMPGMDGISAARCIRETDTDVVIIFVTNLAQYAICGYEVNALDYVLKPINYYALSMKLKKALRYCPREETKYLILNQGSDVVRIPLHRLYYVEVYNHQLRYCTAEGDFLTTGSRSLTAVAKELAGDGFVRCHNGYLVNLRYVDKLEGNNVQVAGELLPVSRKRRKDFLQALLDDAKGGVKQ